MSEHHSATRGSKAESLACVAPLELAEHRSPVDHTRVLRKGIMSLVALG